ncbi:transcription activator, AraC family [Gottschalkia acidurici 9a]|uniref:Transcription activator, AraC family n=1 Tax=Gottschalkia acidurici (strain ATCC 7906 / DSM 604 / BCRC 14475 / CIP 104303 / KCTC 5404 / NCIMB 10678 / 9a) TaxID=1128398 RepID=K0B096_GOTA9|nr:AraC family transcriptional regulator [Gottschalkia acidurici]AFS78462.1 transcription activator, AraC family [Gottschalkia acidurici 9a]
MDFIQNLQRAIDYMEEHILEPITYEDVAKHLYISNYHFHRTFSLVTGITANEYIRNRRLSMAGQELSISCEKVINIASKYRYHSPESFTKAFTRFHGVTPSAARHAGIKLKSFNRLLVKIKLEGGTVMDYRIEKRKGFKVLAKVMQFRNESILEEGNTEIQDFWKECWNDGVFGELKENTTKHDTYGVCASISKESTHFDYGIGMEFNGDNAPNGYNIWEVKPTLWAVFKCIGKGGDCIEETWNKIFSEFLPGSEYIMTDDTDFELYSEGFGVDCFCEIWIPVKKKINA